MTDGLLVLGWREWVTLPDLLPRATDAVNAKIDTGARTSALHAWNIRPVQRDGDTWLDFVLHPFQDDDDHAVPARARQVDERQVTSSNGVSETRPVIRTTLALGPERYEIELTLADRDVMAHRMLLGRTALAGRCVVDPRRSHVLGHPARDPAEPERY